MITDNVKTRTLWPKAKKYIEDNRGRMSIAEMARNLNVGRTSVENYMSEKNFIPRKFAATPAPKDKPSEKYFRHDKNWMI